MYILRLIREIKEDRFMLSTTVLISKNEELKLSIKDFVGQKCLIQQLIRLLF